MLYGKPLTPKSYCTYDLGSASLTAYILLCSVRVSNELGRGNGKAAKFSVEVILYTSLLIGIFFWILCLAFGHQISYLFTSSEEVAKAVSSLSVPLAFSILLNNVGPVLSG